MDRTLLLNTSYEPLLVISWQKAITLMFLDKVEVVAHYDREVRSARSAMRLPAVVRLTQRVRHVRSELRFNRAAIYARDQYQCQYCADEPGTSLLTYDHVIPKSRGGRTSWTNIVTCCTDCNRKKGNRTPQEAGMLLLSQPGKPEGLTVIGKTLLMEQPPEAWRPFLPRGA